MNEQQIFLYKTRIHACTHANTTHQTGSRWRAEPTRDTLHVCKVTSPLVEVRADGVVGKGELISVKRKQKDKDREIL
jgi:hypothetical protein